ncbi:MAG TPA: pilin [Candidatus Saccharimonadia bacterium]|nr:pilin [Candidatus Saccharimonadia bacterium]
MRRLILNIIVALSLAIPVLATPLPAFACAAGNSSEGQTLQGINQSGCDDKGVQKVIHAAVNILSLVVGALAVIMIILAGFKYITSGGEQQAVANAKSTLVYALVGVAVAALAQILVHFVLFQTQKAAG